MRNLLEGLRAADLEDLVLPLISVDEYVSKIDDDAIVIAFFVSEESAAKDLNRFVQRSPIDILDTEISPAPDSSGHFLVFVELLNNDVFAQNVTSILQEVGALTNITNWKMMVRGFEELIPYNQDLLQKIANALSKSILSESILQFLQKSSLENASVRGKNVTLYGNGAKSEFELVSFSPEGKLPAAIANLRPSLTESDMSHTMRLQRMLGSNWIVDRYGDIDILRYSHSPTVLALRQRI